MRVRFADRKLERLEADAGYMAGLGRDIVKAYRKVMQLLRSAVDERDLYAVKSLHFEKLKGNRSHQRSLRLNRQFRLIIEIEEENEKTIVVISIEDYH
ncbi:MAG: type II toxin-antitoxin system RelE/ParE family toxin [Tepidisphaeraceae bacterium]